MIIGISLIDEFGQFNILTTLQVKYVFTIKNVCYSNNSVIKVDFSNENDKNHFVSYEKGIFLHKNLLRDCAILFNIILLYETIKCEFYY